MKKICVLIAVLIIAVGSVFAGGKKEASAPSSSMPDWMNDRPYENAFSGVGIAKLQNQSLGLQTAISRARRAVAEQAGVLVQGFLEDLQREAGTLNDATSIQFNESFTRDLVNQFMVGATPDQQTLMDDGTWWVRVTLSKDDVKKGAADVLSRQAASEARAAAIDANNKLDNKIDAVTTPPPDVRSED